MYIKVLSWLLIGSGAIGLIFSDVQEVVGFDMQKFMSRLFICAGIFGLLKLKFWND